MSALLSIYESDENNLARHLFLNLYDLINISTSSNIYMIANFQKLVT
jgi:hypothetical protein